MFVLQVIFYVIFVYGLLSLIQDVANEFTYKKISHNMKIVIFTNDLEKNIEQFIVELYNMKKTNPYKRIVIIDLEENDDIFKIRDIISKNGINVEILNLKEGEQYINELLISNG